MSNKVEAKTADDTDVIDPLLYLMQAITNTAGNEMLIQGSAANVAQCWAVGAYNNVQNGDQLLENEAAAMQGLTGEALTRAQVQYQTDQTTVSNVNQQYSNVTQGGTTILTSLTQVQAQVIQSAQIVQGNMDNVNNNISGWSA